MVAESNEWVTFTVKSIHPDSGFGVPVYGSQSMEGIFSHLKIRLCGAVDWGLSRTSPMLGSNQFQMLMPNQSTDLTESDKAAPQLTLDGPIEPAS